MYVLMNVCMYDNGIMNVLLLNLGSEREFSMWIFVTALKTGVPSNVEHNWEELGVSNDLTNENCRKGGVWFDPIIRIQWFYLQRFDWGSSDIRLR